MKLQELIANRHVTIVLGPGGVGKTSFSVALAFLAALKGRRVGLLSIDPAKRLADALGITLGTELKRIPLDAPGSVHATMLDQRQVFDDMARKHAPNASIAQKIVDHPLYDTVSMKISSALEYMALAKLQEMADSSAFDYIVVDTPPDTNAIDFLVKPNVLAGFVDHKVMAWLIKPFHLANKLGLKKFLNLGERLMGGVARVTGIQALTMLSEFLILLQNVIDGFHHAGESIAKTLDADSTGFLIITTPQPRSFRSTKNLIHQLHEFGYQIDGVIFNKLLPNELRQKLSKHYPPESHPLAASVVERFTMESALMRSITDLVASPSLVTVMIDQTQAALHSIESMRQFAVDLKAASTY